MHAIIEQKASPLYLPVDHGGPWPRMTVDAQRALVCLQALPRTPTLVLTTPHSCWHFWLDTQMSNLKLSNSDIVLLHSVGWVPR